MTKTLFRTDVSPRTPESFNLKTACKKGQLARGSLMKGFKYLFSDRYFHAVVTPNSILSGTWVLLLFSYPLASFLLVSVV